MVFEEQDGLVNLLTLLTSVTLPPRRRLGSLLLTLIVLAFITTSNVLLLDDDHGGFRGELFAGSSQSRLRRRLGLSPGRFRQNNLIAFLPPLPDDLLNILGPGGQTVQADGHLLHGPGLLLLHHAQALDVQPQQLARLQQLLGLGETERLLAVSECEDVLEPEEGGDRDVREGEERGGEAGEVRDEIPDQGTEHDQHVTREAHFLLITARNHQFPGAGAHQLEGGLEHEKVEIVIIFRGTDQRHRATGLIDRTKLRLIFRGF